MVAHMYPHLEDEAILDPVEGLQPFEMRLLWEQEGQAVSPRPLVFYQDCPRVGCQWELLS